MTAKTIDRRLAAAAIAAAALYLALAYLLAPFFWRHFEHQPKLAGSRRRPGRRSGFWATRFYSANTTVLP
jgi:hypothetical protein